ncbi:hypothetical protein DM02DRAFT_542433 [Periconia macrospinosa]|uniref:HMG box domain-containing protein n=1 Tax=Periconia macrospinosa TaxID=97972 RepID=A0A2V1D4K4_9PLEO|nr:hypothetical protein DM02DRAFT_542433 [Periconia macrospinosa]
MSDLGERLERVGLSQYLDTFVAAGFDTWETVLDITESDLSSLNVKLGHRRKLQRAIAEYGQSYERPLPLGLNRATSIYGSSRSGEESGTETRGNPSVGSAAGGTASTKRKYRRHPKPDEHAPERPPSAYVIFSNQVREALKGQDLSFTEIAKVVGERWQMLPAEAREACESQANVAKERYYAMLTEYKKTPQYEAYQKYLEEFKAKHAAPQKGKSKSDLAAWRPALTVVEGNRSKTESDTVASTRSSSHENYQPCGDRAHGRHISLVPERSNSGWQQSSESSPPVGPARLPQGPSHPPKSASPATHSMSGFISPRMNKYSPMSTSPRSATLQKENSFETTYSSAVARGAHGQSDPRSTYSSYGHPSYQQSTPTPPSASYGSQYPSSIDLPSRRSGRELTHLPPFTHEDTTSSSDSGGASGTQSGYTGYTGPLLPSLDASKNMRHLPAPVPSVSATHSPLDRPPPAQQQPPPSQSQSQQPQMVQLQHPPPDFRTSSSLAALLRAGELARAADDEEMEIDKEGAP